MSYLTRLREFDALNPIERLEMFLQECPDTTRRAAKEILLLLTVIDRCLEEMFYAKSIYILDNGSLLKWLQTEYSFNKSTYLDSLILLDEADLIFRFTCAKKFHIRYEDLKQLRINSWGKTYTDGSQSEPALKSLAEHYKQLCQDHLKRDRVAYEELIALLKQPITDDSADKVKTINDRLSLCLLS